MTAQPLLWAIPASPDAVTWASPGLSGLSAGGFAISSVAIDNTSGLLTDASFQLILAAPIAVGAIGPRLDLWSLEAEAGAIFETPNVASAPGANQLLGSALPPAGSTVSDLIIRGIRLRPTKFYLVLGNNLGAALPAGTNAASLYRFGLQNSPAPALPAAPAHLTSFEATAETATTVTASWAGGSGGGAATSWFMTYIDAAVDPAWTATVLNDLTVRGAPAFPSKPTYLGSVTDPTYGTKIVRITGDPGTAITGISGGIWGYCARHHYSLDQAWNCDESLIALVPNQDPNTPIAIATTSTTTSGNTLTFATNAVLNTTVAPGYSVADTTTPASIPAGRTVTAITSNTVTISGAAVTVASGDTISFTDAGNPRSWLFLDGQTYAAKYAPTPPPGNQDARWHPTDPTKMIYVDGTSLGYYFPATGTTTLVHTFAGYTGLTLGSFKGFPTPSYVPVVPIMGTRTSDSATVVFSYDLSAGTKSVDIVPATVSSATVSYSGTYIGVINTTDQTYIYNRVSGALVQGPWGNGSSQEGQPSHADITRDQNGDDVYVGSDRTNGGVLIKRRLSDGAITALSSTTSNNFVDHTSARSASFPGWAFATYDGYTEGAGAYPLYLGEIIAAKLDASRNPYRLAHHFSEDPSPNDYYAQVQASVSPSGSRVIFASNWGNPDGQSKRPIQAYVIDLRGATPPTETLAAGAFNATGGVGTALPSGTVLTLRSYANNAAGNSPAAVITATTSPLAPAQLTSFAITGQTTTTITVSWAAGAGGGTALSWSMTYTDSAHPTETAVPGTFTATGGTGTGFSPADNVTLRAYATNSGGTSPAAVTTGATLPLAPAQLVSFVATGETTSSITMSWAAGSGGGAATSWSVTFTDATHPTETAVPGSFGANGGTGTGFPSGDAVTLRAYATNAGGTSPAAVTTATTQSVSTSTPLLTAGQYFMLDPSGYARPLQGSHNWLNGQDVTGVSPSTPFDYAGYLSWLVSQNHSFIRLWKWESYEYGFGGPSASLTSPLPWVQVSAGIFDLNQLNQAYYDRVRERCVDAANSGLYVSVMCFSGEITSGGDPNWSTHPMAPGRNVNGINGDPNNTGGGSFIHQQTSGPIWNFQTAHLDKLIATVGDLTNVLFEPCNETLDDGASRAWQVAVINYIHNKEIALGGLRHPVWLTAPYPPSSSDADMNSWMLSTPADLVAFGGTDGSYQYPNIHAYPGQSKPVILDTDHIYGGGGDWRDVYQAFMDGYSYICMDDLGGTTTSIEDGAYGGYSGSIGGPPSYASERYAMGVVNQLSKIINLNGMIPGNASSESTTGYCWMDAANAKYISYTETPNASFFINLSAASGKTLKVQWADLSQTTLTLTQGGTIAGGSASQHFTSPFGNAMFLILTPV